MIPVITQMEMANQDRTKQVMVATIMAKVAATKTPTTVAITAQAAKKENLQAITCPNFIRISTQKIKI